ncbi:MAG: hypothetical protein IKY83_12870 [Proteobacteria bacterium]|nr:hypothetical protein [Pseudomonadota bacterium]
MTARRLPIYIYSYILLTAQVPYEYFDIHTITPPETTAQPGAIGLGTGLPNALHLDTETQVAGDLSLNDPFLPAVGIYQRQTVFTKIHLTPNETARFSLGIPTHTDQCSLYIPEPSSIPDATYRMAKLTLDMTATDHAILPGDASEMQITQIQATEASTGRPQPLTLWRCMEDDLYIVTFPMRGIYQVAYDTASHENTLPPQKAEFFRGAVRGANTLTKAQTQEIEALISKTPALKRLRHTQDPLVELIRYFQAFHSAPLTEAPRTGETLESRLLREEKGLCRHRAVLFMVLSRYMGYKTRIVGNTVHAFAEIYHHGRWYPVELGGQARSLTIYGWGKDGTALNDFSFNAVDRQVNTPPHTSPAPQARNSKDNDFEFTRTGQVPARLLRDRVMRIEGIMTDIYRRPIASTRFEYELKHPMRESKRYEGMTDASGQISLEIRIPPDWPLGESEAQWHRLSDSANHP